MDERLKISYQDEGMVMWEVQGNNADYEVTFDMEDNLWICICPAYFYGLECWHIKKCKESLEELSCREKH